MDSPDAARLIAFLGHRLIAVGSPVEVGLAVKQIADAPGTETITVLEETTARPVDLDLHGTADEVRQRLVARTEARGRAPDASPRGPGRPRLGVVSREVSLLPRHWEWLAEQSGGASATLRRLVEEAKRSGSRREKARRSQDAAFRFMSALGGDLPGFEEAVRSLYRRDWELLDTILEPWPEDVRAHARVLVATARRDDADANAP